MAHRSPARFLAPLALVAFALALFIVVTSSQTTGGGESSATPNTSGEQSGPDGEQDAEPRKEKKGPRFYVVKPGDTPSAIAEKTDTPLDDIERLNPDIDPQTLSPGTRIRLRR